MRCGYETVMNKIETFHFKMSDDFRRRGTKLSEVTSPFPKLPLAQGRTVTLSEMLRPFTSFKGSSDLCHFIFVLNAGKMRIRHRTTLKSNFLTDSKSIEDVVIQIQSRSL